MVCRRITGSPDKPPTPPPPPSGGTGLLFYNARHYDPAIGAFAQADTIIPNPASPASFNRYAYVANDPVNHTDPSGHIGNSVLAGVHEGRLIDDSETDAFVVPPLDSPPPVITPGPTTGVPGVAAVTAATVFDMLIAKWGSSIEDDLDLQLLEGMLNFFLNEFGAILDACKAVGRACQLTVVAWRWSRLPDGVEWPYLETGYWWTPVPPIPVREVLAGGPG